MSIKSGVVDKHSGLTYERVRELFDYNPATGELIRRITVGNKAKKGKVVGYKNPGGGYLVVCIDGPLYNRHNFAVHRLIWLWMTGKWPEHQIDHINRIRHDNRWCNLREAGDWHQSVNKGIRKNNTSGTTGVVFDKNRNKYRARININGKDYTIGRYDTLDEAKEWRRLAELEFYGEFAPTEDSPKRRVRLRL